MLNSNRRHHYPKACLADRSKAALNVSYRLKGFQLFKEFQVARRSRSKTARLLFSLIINYRKHLLWTPGA
jgi:hypothetical protein